MAERRKDVTVGLDIDGADESRQDLNKIRQATEDWGDEGKQAAQKLTDSFQNVERGADRVNRKITDGKAVTTRDVSVMAQQFAHLEAEIRQTFGTLERAPLEVQQAFQKAERQLDETTRKVRVMDDAAKDHSRTLDEAGQRWTGFGDAVQDAVGPMGAVVGKMGLFVAAAKEGWSIGQQLNKFFQVDMSLWEEQVDRFQKRGSLWLKQQSDELVAFGGVIKAVFNGGADSGESYAERVKKAWGNLRDTQNGAVKDLNAEIDRQNQLLKENEKRQKDTAEAAKKHKEEQEALEKQLEKQLEDLVKLREELEKAAGSHDSVAASIAQQNDVYAASSVAYQNANDRLVEAREEQRRLAAAYGETNPIVTEQAERVRDLEGELSRAKSEMEATAKKVAELKAEEAKLTKSIVENTEKLDKSSEAVKGTADQLDAKSGAILRVKEGILQLEPSWDNLVTRNKDGQIVIANSAKEVKTLGDNAGVAAPKVDQVAEGGIKITQNFNGTAVAIDQATENMKKKMRAMDEYMKKADDVIAKNDELAVSMLKASEAGLGESGGGEGGGW